MSDTALVRAVKAYRLEHRCGLQEAIDAVRGPRTAQPDTMTDYASRLGIVEQIIAGVFRRQPDMSGDTRRRLAPHEYRAVQEAAAEIAALFGKERPSDTRVAEVAEETFGLPYGSLQRGAEIGDGAQDASAMVGSGTPPKDGAA